MCIAKPRSDTSSFSRARSKRPPSEEQTFPERQYLDGWIGDTQVTELLLVPLKEVQGAYYTPDSEGKRVLRALGIRVPRTVRFGGKRVCWESLLQVCINPR